jgi:hypothetical protein
MQTTGVDVLDPRVPLEDAQDVADPGDLLRVVGLLVDDLLAGALADPSREASEGRVIHDEVQVGPVLGGLLQVVRGTRLLVEGAQGQALVDAEVLDAQRPRLLPERIGDLLVVEVPGALAQLGAGVHLPGLDLEALDLALHLLQLLGAEVGPEQAV